jgi:hypothetical protein
MNLQEKLIETTADLRARATALATAAVVTASARAGITAKHLEGVKGALDALGVAGREFNKVARRHVGRLVKANAAVAADARKDVTSLARNTYLTLSAKRGTARPTARKAPTTRKRVKAKAA